MPPLRSTNGGMGLEIWEAGSVSYSLFTRILIIIDLSRGGNSVWKDVHKACGQLLDS